MGEGLLACVSSKVLFPNNYCHCIQRVSSGNVMSPSRLNHWSKKTPCDLQSPPCPCASPQILPPQATDASLLTPVFDKLR